MKKDIMSPEQVARSLAIPDLSDPKNGVHVINLVVERLLRFFTGLSGYPTPVIHRSHPVTTVKECFDDLLFPADSVVRSSVHTRYLSPDSILRPHTSSMIPQVLKTLEKQAVVDSLVFCPSICYRRKQEIDRMHSSEPHQLDIWRIKNTDPYLAKEDLLGLIDGVAHCVIPGQEYLVLKIDKGVKDSHPYLDEAFKGRVKFRGETIGFLEGGIVSQRFLQKMVTDAERYSAISVGIMLERAVMLLKDIDDVRLLRSTDSRIQKQMLDLNQYIPVSKYPSIMRDFSFVTPNSTTIEDLDRMVRVVVGDDITILEEILIIFEVPHEKLPEQAQRRLKTVIGQKNVLLRVVFRSQDRTLRNEEVKDVFERIRQTLGAY